MISGEGRMNPVEMTSISSSEKKKKNPEPGIEPATSSSQALYATV